VLLARADRVEPGLEEAIERRGWSAERVVLYRLLRAERVDPAVKRTISGGEIDVVTFASGGTVRAFAALYGKRLPASVRVVCIGPVTARAAREAGFRVDTIASRHTIPGLAAAAAEAWAAARRAR
jgi:uroporphyrinogen III methyltransferase/synthase